MSGCTSCSRPLDVAAVLTDSTTCTDCERQRIVFVADPWATFVRVLRSSVRPDGTVHACDVRPKVKGRIKPQKISSCWREAQSPAADLIRQTDEVERSDDREGKNAGRPEYVYRATERLLRNRSAA